MAKIVWPGPAVYAEIATKSDKLINAAALEVRTEAQNSMRPPKSGRIYKVPNFAQTYQASAPGEAPAIRTTDLQSSIMTEYVGKLHQRVGSNLEYARRLELGDRAPDKHGVFIAARPYLRPALEKVIAKYKGKVNL